MDLLSLIPYQLSPWQWVALVLAGLCIGMSKTWINGISTIAIPLFAFIFGAKASTGIILPLLCVADLFAVIYYRRHAEWKYILRLLPWALAGFGIALLVERIVPARGFKLLIGVCILAGLPVMFWNDRRAKAAASSPASPAAALAPAGRLQTYGVTALFGIVGGFSTMIGNAAGPVMSVFLLSVRLPKTSFIGTAAWFFLIVNYLKIPLQVFVWGNISAETLRFDIVMAPIVLLGAWGGIIFIKKTSEANYRLLVYALTILSTVLMFI
jgi:uncharacterized membrane protein YfcA